MNGYNLTIEQKKLLRKLVGYVREGQLQEPILPIASYTSDRKPQIEIHLKGSSPDLSLGDMGDFGALCDEDLMGCRWNRQSTYKLYNIKQAGYEAVDNDFMVLPSFENVLLGQDQEELLSILAEAARNVPREQRRKFYVSHSFGKTSSDISHSGLPGRRVEAYIGDIETLNREGLIALSYGPHDRPLFDVTPRGFKYYEYIKQRAGEPVQRIETMVRDYLGANHFQSKHPEAYQKWAEAESMLWGSDSERQSTTIGHLCREAMQEFADALVEQYQPPDVSKDRTKTVDRIRAVLDLRKEQLGKTEHPFLEALLPYWGTVSDLVQRQEHGAQKEGETLVWEDARRVVFQTAVVMFEIDKALSRAR